jgi:hypothetical protein
MAGSSPSRIHRQTLIRLTPSFAAASETLQ